MALNVLQAERVGWAPARVERRGSILCVVVGNLLSPGLMHRMKMHGGCVGASRLYDLVSFAQLSRVFGDVHSAS